MASEGVGSRIAVLRRRRGLSQAVLAGLVGRSESWLSQVERGVRVVDRLSVLVELARVLEVDVDELIDTASPSGSISSDDNVLAPLRAALLGYPQLTGEYPRGTLALSQLGRNLTEQHEAYQAARYGQVIRAVPELLSHVETHRSEAAGGQRSDAVLCAFDAYHLAAKLATKLGAADLALIAADRTATLAVDAGSVVLQGLAAFQVGCALLLEGNVASAQRLVQKAAEQAMTGREGVDTVSVSGALHLLAALISARRADRWAAGDALTNARLLAERLGHEGNHHWTAFGPTNVAIHELSVAAAFGDVGAVLRLEPSVRTSSLPASLVSRRAQVHLDIAVALAHRRRDGDATLRLLEAERLGAQVVVHNVAARKLIRQLYERSPRRRDSPLAALAGRAGVAA